MQAVNTLGFQRISNRELKDAEYCVYDRDIRGYIVHLK